MGQIFRGGNGGGDRGGRSPRKFEVGGMEVLISPQYFNNISVKFRIISASVMIDIVIASNIKAKFF